MERNELRINNSIEVGALCCPYGIGEVAEILADCVLVRINGSYHEYLYDDISPIQLTEEWLVRFGFTSKNRVDFESNCGVLDLEATDAGYLFDSRIVIKHVNQLQNLFYFLCGKELELLH